MNKRYRLTRKILIFLTLFVGIGAIMGSMCMLIDPSGKLMGMDALIPYFQVLPLADTLFQNLIFSGIMLLIVNGITNIIAFVLILQNKKIGTILGSIFGITLMLWIIIQFIILPFNFMSTLFFIIGFVQCIVGYTCYVGYEQSQFHFDTKDYTNIGTNPNKLVVFFSRSGHTKKIAYETANQSGAEIVEITTTEKISGNAGFWWCGRYAMHKWGMPINKINIEWDKYSDVTICTPVWAFGVSAPIRQFCLDNRGKIKNVHYISTHYMGTKFISIAKELDKLLDTTHVEYLSYRCHYNKLKQIKHTH